MMLFSVFKSFCEYSSMVLWFLSSSTFTSFICFLLDFYYCCPLVLLSYEQSMLTLRYVMLWPINCLFVWLWNWLFTAVFLIEFVYFLIKKILLHVWHLIDLIVHLDLSPLVFRFVSLGRRATFSYSYVLYKGMEYYIQQLITRIYYCRW